MSLNTRKIHKKKNIRTKGEKIIFSIAFIMLAIHSILLIYPFVWMIISSFKSIYDYTFNNAFALPEKWMLSNYVKVFSALNVRGHGFFTMIINSVWWTAGNTILGVFMSAVLAYCLARYDFKLKKVMYSVVIIIMIVPIFGSGAAAYKQAQDLGIINSPLMLIKSLGGYSGFQFLILYATFKNIPWDYAESAFMDGANHFQVFYKIMLPLAKGPLVSLGIISAISVWNDYMVPLIYLYDFPTLSTGLYLYENQMMYDGANYPMYFAGVTIALIPILIVFVIFQKTIMDNTSIGGLKG